MPKFRTFWVALQFLTILPTPAFKTFSAKDEEKAVYWYPVVGAIVGSIVVAIFLLCYWLTNEIMLSVLLAILANILITGALHIDGLADSADALLSSKSERKAKLLIMKDSRIGTMGALVLIFYLLLKWELLSLLPFELIWKSLFLEPILGKFFIFLVMKQLPYVSINSKLLTRFQNIIPNWWYGVSFGFIFTFPFLVYPFNTAAWVIVISLAGTALFMRWAKKSLGGATGDIYGTTQELVGLLIPLACFIAVKTI